MGVYLRFQQYSQSDRDVDSWLDVDIFALLEDEYLPDQFQSLLPLIFQLHKLVVEEEMDNVVAFDVSFLTLAEVKRKGASFSASLLDQLGSVALEQDYEFVVIFDEFEGGPEGLILSVSVDVDIRVYAVPDCFFV